MKNYVYTFKSATLIRGKHLSVLLKRLKNLRLFVWLSLFLFSNWGLFAQEDLGSILKSSDNFYRVTERAEAYFRAKHPNVELRQLTSGEYRDGEYVKFLRWSHFWENRLTPNGTLGDPTAYYLRKNNLSRTNSSYSEIEWRNIGLLGNLGGQIGVGRTTAVEFHPTDVNTFWVATAMGGIWKTQDGGQSYVAIGDNLPTLATADVLVDKSNTNTLYVATGDRVGYGLWGIGVMKSIDGGNNWQSTALQWSFSDYARIYALEADPTNPQVIYAATDKGFFKTTDGFTTVNQINTDPAYDVRFKPNDSNTLYYTAESGFWKSSDGGNNFSLRKTVPSPWVIRITVSAADPNRVYFSNRNDLYQSYDSGNSFQSPKNIESLGNRDFGYCIMSAQDPNVIYGGYFNTWRSTDNGATWNKITCFTGRQDIHVDNHFAAINPLDPSSVYFCNDGGLYAFEENSCGDCNSCYPMYRDLSAGMLISQYYDISNSQQNTNLIGGGTQDNGSFFRSSSGQWQYYAPTGDGMVAAIDPTDDNYQYWAYQDGDIQRYSNGSNTCISCNIPNNEHENGAWVTPYLLDPNDPATIIAGYSRIYRSEDRGNTWTQISDELANGGDMNLLAIAPSNSSVVYAIHTPYRSPSQLFRSTNADQSNPNWTTISLPFAVRSIAVDIHDENRLYITRGGFSEGRKVFRSDDGGENWTNISGSLPNVPANVIKMVGDPAYQDALFVGTDAGVYYRDANADDWEEYGELAHTYVRDIEFQYAEGLIRIGTYGRSIFEAPFPEQNNTLPDYTITAMSPPSTFITPGVLFYINATYKNQGNANNSIRGLTRFYLSNDANLDETDTPIRVWYTEPLDVDQVFRADFSMKVPEGTPNGNYYVIMEVDYTSVIDESNEDNNVRAVQVTVGDIDQPDYQPTDFHARGGGTTVQAGGTIVIDLKINNNGPVDGLGNGGKDKYYLNATPDINNSPVFLRDFGTADITANSHYDVNSGPLTIPETTTPGTYYIVFFHDADDKIAESNEDNNITSLEITVTAPGSGLGVDFSADQSSICVGGSVQFTAQVSSGDRLAYDQTGNGNKGELLNFSGTPFVEHAGYGKALAFEGNNNYVELPENLTASLNDFTFEARFFYDGTGGRWQRIMDFGNSTSVNMWLTPNNYRDRTQFAISNNNTSAYLENEEVLTPNQWYHFAVTLAANGDARLYINGALKAQKTISLKVSDLGNLSDNWLGKSQYADPYLKGKLDEVRIWRTARTQQQIQDHKGQELTGNENGLLVYFDFNQQVSNATYNWVFEGGNPATSNAANPSVTYASPGTYPVSLTVSSGGQTDAEVKENYITVKGCEPDWTITETADYHLVLVPSNADITLSGQSIAIGDYLGAFYNDNGTLKCAGKTQWTGQYLSITVYGDDTTTPNTKEGLSIGESFQWKLWKASTGQELYATATYQTPAGRITHTGQFAVNGISEISSMRGTTQPPQTASQTITLEAGWNYISSYIIANQSNLSSIFNDIQSDIIIVKNGEGEVYMPNPAMNGIGNWNVADGYQVKVSGSSQVPLTLTGQKVDLARTVIPLSAGHNLFAYLRENEQPVQVAMAPIANEVELVTDVKGRAYIPSFGINNIGNMKPGQGYWATMRSTVDLSYTARLATPPANMHTAQIAPNKYRIARKGSHHATLILDTKGLVAYGDEIGVFDTESNLVGAATYEDHILAFPIWGDDPTTAKVDGLAEGDIFEIRVWNKNAEIEDIYDFNANTDSYTANGVIEAALMRTTATNSQLEANSLKLYPNPTQNAATLSLALKSQAIVKVTLFDLAGKRLLNIAQGKMVAGNYEWKINTKTLPNGLYHCRVLVDGVTNNIPFSVVK